VIGLGFLGALACGEDAACPLGTNRCVGERAIERCVEEFDPYEPPHWERGECADDDRYQSSLCAVAPTGYATCAAEAGARPDLCPIPDAPSGAMTWACDGAARAVGCVDGLIGLAQACGPGTCFVTADGAQALCSVLPAPDPRCEAPTTSSTCADATTRIACRDGYRVEQDACPDAGGCQVGSLDGPSGTFEVGLCALAAAPDPGCDEPAVAGETGFCQAGAAINCYLGRIVSRTACLGECFDHGAWSECLGGPTEPDQGWQRGDPPACADGFDNDHDGLLDFPDDPGCAAPCCGWG
jgi:hypothetical protein